jgi:hypothetical protein
MNKDSNLKMKNKYAKSKVLFSDRIAKKINIFGVIVF